MNARRLMWASVAADSHKIPYRSDKLESTPSKDELVLMSLLDQLLFIRTARLQEGCKPDKDDERARILACYVLNNAYTGDENGVEH